MRASPVIRSPACVASASDSARLMYACPEIGRTVVSPSVSNGTGPLTRAPGRSVAARSSVGCAKARLTMPVAGASRLQSEAEQREEHQALPLGNQVRAIQQGVAQPREQLDQRAAGIAEARVRPFRRVRRDARDQVLDEVVEAAIVQAEVEEWACGNSF